MEINIAGAGAGKTTKLANRILYNYKNTNDFQNIYCITYTNNATDKIKEKLYEEIGFIPNRVKISTIHSFLHSEFINPYHFLIFGKHYNYISTMHLPSDPKSKMWELSKLDKSNVLHVSVISQKAKWIYVSKSNDSKELKRIRNTVKATFAKYCGAVLLDEAQDIDNDFFYILKEMNQMGIKIEIMGDPKQDLKGFGNLRKLENILPNNLRFFNECYRCPQNHLNLSNSIICEAERQNSAKNYGKIDMLFESECNVADIISKSDFDLLYISTKNERFETHEFDGSKSIFEKLMLEIKLVFKTMYSDQNEDYISREAFYYARNLLNELDKTNNCEISMSRIFKNNRLDKKSYAQIINELNKTTSGGTNKIILKSIESIKGQEGSNCFFVLTSDLAAYLFLDKIEDNKIKNRLYVALTRSLDRLTILITKEVEVKYSKELINDRLSKYF